MDGGLLFQLSRLSKSPSFDLIWRSTKTSRDFVVRSAAWRPKKLAPLAWKKLVRLLCGTLWQVYRVSNILHGDHGLKLYFHFLQTRNRFLYNLINKFLYIEMHGDLYLVYVCAFLILLL